jgi:hypothetical protein
MVKIMKMRPKLDVLNDLATIEEKLIPGLDAITRNKLVNKRKKLKAYLKLYNKQEKLDITTIASICSSLFFGNSVKIGNDEYYLIDGILTKKEKENE